MTNNNQTQLEQVLHWLSFIQYAVNVSHRIGKFLPSVV